jgi:hypothetical protein
MTFFPRRDVMRLDDWDRYVDIRLRQHPRGDGIRIGRVCIYPSEVRLLLANFESAHRISLWYVLKLADFFNGDPNSLRIPQ